MKLSKLYPFVNVRQLRLDDSQLRQLRLSGYSIDSAMHLEIIEA